MVDFVKLLRDNRDKTYRELRAISVQAYHNAINTSESLILRMDVEPTHADAARIEATIVSLFLNAKQGKL